jgi:hypothetical protein
MYFLKENFVDLMSGETRKLSRQNTFKSVGAVAFQAAVEGVSARASVKAGVDGGGASVQPGLAEAADESGGTRADEGHGR